jgi:hypothetical protein
MIDENSSSSSHHEQVQAITNLRNGGIINRQVDEKRTERIGPPKKPNLDKGKGVINEEPIWNEHEKLSASQHLPFTDQILGS